MDKGPHGTIEKYLARKNIDSMIKGLTGAGEPERVDVVCASANLFEVLGVQPRLGGGFMEEEDQPSRN